MSKQLVGIDTLWSSGNDLAVQKGMDIIYKDIEMTVVKEIVLHIQQLCYLFGTWR